ncbi:hypothetical protein SDC9_143230 [bioreactor metagenome]|uniref:Uncharacterized protein n=1 Tax=bioreactor metagenome TaxID=1076179 RepID=A0A645E5J3_9ZZZZ
MRAGEHRILDADAPIGIFIVLGWSEHNDISTQIDESGGYTGFLEVVRQEIGNIAFCQSPQVYGHTFLLKENGLILLGQEDFIGIGDFKKPLNLFGIRDFGITETDPPSLHQRSDGDIQTTVGG